MNDVLTPEEREALADTLREHLLVIRATQLETPDANQKQRLKSKEEVLKSILAKIVVET